MTAAPGALQLAGARALVTGGSSGIGAATAALLARRGASVVVSGRDRSALDAVAATLPKGAAFAADLTVPGAPARVVAGAVATLGGLDIVVSNAGAGWAGPFTQMAPDELDAVLDLNLRVPAHLIRAALPHLRRNPPAHIVIVGSIAALLPVAGEAAYSAAKAGAAALGEALRAEVRGEGVAVSCVHPGVVDTAFFSRRNRPYERRHPRPIPAADVADAVVATIEQGRATTVVPAWLGVPVRLRGALPAIYRRLADRFA